MALLNYKNNPEYPDRYDRSKRWVKVLPIAGRHLQTAELIEMQSILHDNLKQGMNTLFKNGRPLEGLIISLIPSADVDNVYVKVSPGQLYVEGMVLDVKTALLDIPRRGEFDIGVEVKEEIITELEDPTLRDPIKGWDLYGTAGAARLTWSARTILNTADQNGYVIGKVVNGVVVQEVPNPFFYINEILAQRTYERSGNFCVSGLSVTAVAPTDTNIQIADSKEYNKLQTNLSAKTEQQQAVYTQALDIETEVNNLKAQLATASDKFNTSPTIANSQIVTDLGIQITQAQTKLASTSIQLLGVQKDLLATQESLRKAEALLLDKELFSVSPGIAYVLGYRVELTTPTLLYVPRDVPVVETEQARFTYSGSPAQTLREFSLAIPEFSNINDTSHNTVLSFKFSGLSNFTLDYISSTYSVVVERTVIGISHTLAGVISAIALELSHEGNGFPVSSLYKYKLFNSSNQEVTQFLDGGTISAEVKRRLLTTQIGTEEQGLSSLLFISKSTPTLDINLEITSNRVSISTGLVLGGSSNILVNIPSASLAGGIIAPNFQLGFRPVASIKKLSAEVENTTTVVRGSTRGTADKIVSSSSVTKILRVSQGIRTFVPGLDYRISSTQDGVSWLSITVGSEPEPGTSYVVVYVSNTELTEEIDFKLDKSTDTISFIPGGVRPALNQNFTVDYSYYLGRSGVITLDKSGQLSYITSEAAAKPSPPNVPPDLLAIANFALLSDRANVSQTNCRRQTVTDLHNLADRVRANSKNLAILALDLEAIRYACRAAANKPCLPPLGQNPTPTPSPIQIGLVDEVYPYPSGLFNDPFQDLSKLEMEVARSAFSQGSSAGENLAGATDEYFVLGDVVPTIQAITLNSYHKDIPLRYEDNVSNIDGVVYNNMAGYKSFIALPHTNVSLVSQPRSTTTQVVGPSLSRGHLYLSHNTIFLNKPYKGLTPCDPISKIVHASQLQTNDPYVKTIIESAKNIFSHVAELVATSLQDGNPLSGNYDETDSFVNYSLESVKGQAILISLRAEGLEPNSIGYRLLFDGKDIPPSRYNLVCATPMGPDGLAQAKADGSIYATFTMPDNTPIGVHSVELVASSGYCKARLSVYNNLLTQMTLTAASSWGARPLNTSSIELLPQEYSDYSSDNLLQIGVDNSLFPDVIPTTLSEQLTQSHNFPIAHSSVNQTFEVQTDVLLTQVRLKLEQGPTSNNARISIYIKDTNNNQPGQTIYAVGQAEVYSFSSRATDWTTFILDRPTLLRRGYKYTLAVSSSGYSLRFDPRENEASSNSNSVPFKLFSAVINEPDINNGNLLGNQLYVQGDMYTSEDGVSLLNHQRQDLTFELVRASFDQRSATVALGTYGTFDVNSAQTGAKVISYFALNTRDVTPPGTEITYEYLVGSTWKRFYPNTATCLSEVTSSISLRANLTSTLSTVSPLLLLEGSSVSIYSPNTQYSLVMSKLVTYPSPYTKVRIKLEFIKPEGTKIEVHFVPRAETSVAKPWYNLNMVASSLRIVNQALGLYEAIWAYDHPNNISPVNFSLFRYIIRLSSNQPSNQPLIKNIISYVS